MNKELDSSKLDYIVTIAKSGLGLVPVVGSLLAELAGTVIPNQRIDRLVDFARRLEARLGTLEQEKLVQQCNDAECSDLLEEGMRQAASSLSDDRREYIASIIQTSLTTEEISHQESKHLLKILGDLSDVEIIWLRSYLNPTLDGDNEFRERHAAVLTPPRAYLDSPQSEIDKSAIVDSYRNHLFRLGLLEQHYKLDSKTKQLKVDHSGRLERQSYSLTGAGRLLLRSIGLDEQS